MAAIDETPKKIHTKATEPATDVDSVTIETKPTGRALDFMERMYFGPGWMIVNVSMPIVIESENLLSKELLKNAAVLLNKRHPLLRSRVITEAIGTSGKTNYLFREMDQSDKVDVRLVDGVDWTETQVSDGKINYNEEEGPLWRLWLHKSIEIPAEERQFGHPYRTNLVLGMHHGIMDGNSAMRLIDDLLTMLELIQNKPDGLPEVDSLPLIPGCFHMVDVSLPWYKLYKVIGMGLKQLTKSKTDPFSENCKDELDSRQGVKHNTRIHPMILPPTLTSKIINASKKNEVTVHAALTVASAVAVTKFIHGNNLRPGKSYPLNTFCSVNLRRFLPPNTGNEHVSSAFGNLEVPLKGRVVSKPAPFWEMAKSCHRAVHRMVNNEVMEMPKVLNFLMNLGVDPIKSLLKSMKKMPHGLMGPVFSMSNMGRCDFIAREGGRSYELAEVYMCVAADSCSPLFVNNIFTFHGRLFWSVVYFTRLTSEERVKEYADLIVECLEMACVDETK